MIAPCVPGRPECEVGMAFVDPDGEGAAILKRRPCLGTWGQSCAFPREGQWRANVTRVKPDLISHMPCTGLRRGSFLCCAERTL